MVYLRFVLTAKLGRGSHTSFSLVEPVHIKPNAKLSKNTPAKMPYTQPTCCDIQSAAGVPAKSAKAIGMVMGKWQGQLTTQRTSHHYEFFAIT
jgi:hypothetical protein